MHYLCWAAAVAGLVLGVTVISAADRRDDLATPFQVVQVTRAAPETDGARTSPEAAATVLDKDDVQSILGRQVLSSAGEDMGRVIDIVVDRNGQVRAAVIDFGGFLGVGNRKVAIDWNALHFAPTGSKYDRITLELTRDQVKAAPEYKDGRPLVVLGTAEGLQPSPPPN
jgi:sporulation protein YlmC with PRC-barrel domain